MPARFLPWLKQIPVHRPRWLLAAAIAGALAGCASSNPAYDPNKPHHVPDGFRNLYASPHGEPDGGFWAWQWQRLRSDLPADRPERVPRASVDLDTVLVAHEHWLDRTPEAAIGEASEAGVDHDGVPSGGGPCG